MPANYVDVVERYTRYVEGVVVERPCGFDSHHRHQTINSSMRKVLLFSVPHTGTVFTRNYIVDVLDIPHYRNLKGFIEKDVTQMHVNLHATYGLGTSKNPSNDVIKYAEENCNVVIPLRDPTDNAMSCLGRKHNDLNYCIQNWKMLLEIYPRFKNVFWVDVWTPEENRRTMMQKLNEFLDIEPHPTYVERFVRDWKKVNYRKTEQILEAERRLPFHDLSSLDFAVEWYKEKKAELDKLYSPLPTD